MTPGMEPLATIREIGWICNNCEKHGHNFNGLLIVTEEKRIRNASYCVCCGMILEN